MIRSFGSKDTERIWWGIQVTKISPEIQRIGLRKLRMLNRSASMTDLRVPPSNRLEKLSGNLKGYHSIRVNDRWRIIFLWIEEEAYEVEIIDYH